MVKGNYNGYPYYARYPPYTPEKIKIIANFAKKFHHIGPKELTKKVLKSLSVIAAGVLFVYMHKK
jgi:hypothetical protein